MQGPGRKYPFDALWLSHTSISNFEKCPRLYYLYHIYKDPKSGHKIQVVNPYLSLGMTVHGTIEEISGFKKDERFTKPLIEIFQNRWSRHTGKLGGFSDPEEEDKFKERGRAMIKRITQHPGPLANLAVKIVPPGDAVASMWLSAEEKIILCGNVDWVEYLPEGSLHIVDFKTGKHDEDDESLQLAIYFLLTTSLQRRQVSKVSYWYLDHDDEPVTQPMPNTKEAIAKILEFGRKMQDLRGKNPEDILCPQGECRYCRDYERVVKDEAECVGYDLNMKRDLYFVS